MKYIFLVILFVFNVCDEREYSQSRIVAQLSSEVRNQLKYGGGLEFEVFVDFPQVPAI